MNTYYWQNLPNPVAGKISHVACHRIVPGRLACHKHDFYEVFWGIAGTAIHQVNGNDILAETGDLFLIRPADSHGITCISKEPYVFMNIAFESYILDDLKKRYFADKQDFWSESLDLPRKISLTRSQQEWLTASANDVINDVCSRFLLDRFLINLIHEFTEIDNDRFKNCPDWLKDACSKLYKLSSFQHGAQELAHLAKRTPEHVARTLKSCTGLTCSQVINDARIQCISEQLLTGSKDIQELAFETGFNSISHFYKCFKEKFGMTPYQYRKQHVKVVST